jgi:hypothetical protein
MDDDTPAPGPNPPKAASTAGLTEAELSRIAREAVHQPADARLDKQLVRMGLLDGPEPAEPKRSQAIGGAVAIDPEIERLRKELGRTRMILWVLLAISAILLITVLVLLFR